MPQGQPFRGEAPPPGFLGWLASQRRRFALWAPVALGCGALVFLLPAFEPPAWTGAAALALAGGAMLARRFLPRGAVVLAGLALVALGHAVAVLRAETVATPVLRAPTLAVEVSGRVLDAFGHRDGRARILLALDGVPGLKTGEAPAVVRIALRKVDGLPRPGDRLALRVRLTPLTLPVTPGGYDFARAAWFDGIGAYGYALGPPRLLPPAEEASPVAAVQQWIAGRRFDASARIHALLPGSTGAIAAALTVGDRSQIAARDDEALRDSSLAHVLSISGLHMAIVGLGTFGLIRFAGALVRPIALRFQLKKWAAAGALLAAAVYLAISGASVPAQRSFLMIGLVFVAVLIDRSAFTLRMVAVSAGVVLLLAPESVLDPSFQMSFAAVTALVAAFEAFEDWQVRRGRPLVMRDGWGGRFGYWLLVAVLASSVAGAATAPYAAFHFNRIAFYGVLANVAAMPVISFVIMPFCALGLVLMPFGLDAWAFQVAGWGIDAMLAIARWTSDLPGAAGHVASWPDLALGLVTLGGLWLALWRGRWRLAGLAPIAAAMALGWLALPPDILIDRDAKNVAVRAADGRLAVVSGRRARFTATEWLERDGDERAVAASARAGREGVWTCEDKLCVARVRGLDVGYMERAGSGARACAAGLDIVIAAREIEPCAQGLTLTAADVARDGAMALYIAPDGTVSIDTVRRHIGERRWTVWSGEGEL